MGLLQEEKNVGRTVFVTLNTPNSHVLCSQGRRSFFFSDSNSESRGKLDRKKLQGNCFLVSF